MEITYRKKILCSILTAGMFLTAGCTQQPPQQNSEQNKEKVVKQVLYKRPDVKNAEESIALLKEGNERFTSGKLANIDVGTERRKELEKGQDPLAVVVGCSDSRVTPTVLFDQGLGDLFEIRVAGNVLDADAVGSIEYAVEHLHTPLIVVLGHQSCGAVTAAVETIETNAAAPGSIGSLVAKIKPAVEKVKDSNKQVDGKAFIEEAIEVNVKNVTKELEKSPIIKEKLEKDEVKIIGAKYLLDSGKVQWYEKEL